MHRTEIQWALILILGLSGGSAWGQGLEGPPMPPQPPARLELAVEVGFFAQAEPELTVRATWLKGPWQLSAEVTRTLIQSPSWRFRLSEHVSKGPATIGVGLGWESRVGFSADFNLNWNDPPQRANISGGASPQEGMSWMLNWDLGWEDLSVQAEQLRFSTGRWEVLKRATLSWQPASWLSVRLQADRTGLKPLEVAVKHDLGGGLSLSILGQFAIDERLRLHGLGLGFTQGRLGAGVSLAPDGRWRSAWLGSELLRGGVEFSDEGWREIWVKGAQAVGSGRLKGRVTFGPEGWRGLKLEAGLPAPLYSGSLQGVLDLKKESWDLKLSTQISAGPGSSLQGTLSLGTKGWGLHLEGQLLELIVFLQGKMDLGPQGIASLMLMGNAALGDLWLDGLFNYSGGIWLLDLSGGLPLGLWELLGTSSWSSLGGWEWGSLGVVRLFDLARIDL